MARKEMIVTVPGRYGTRMLKAGDTLVVPEPTARALMAIGKAELKSKAKKAARQSAVEQAPPPAEPDQEPDQESDELTELRAEYTDKIGKRPYHGWDAATLREKIDAA